MAGKHLSSTLLLILTTIVLIGCDENAGEDNWQMNNLNGITEVTINGEVLSVDASDWSGNNTFYPFKPPAPPDTSGSGGDTTGTGGPSVGVLPESFAFGAPAYPNPVKFIPASVSIQTPEASTIHVWVIDQEGSTVSSLIDGYLPAGCHSVQFDPSGKSAELYRVLFESGDFHGTGDIQISPTGDGTGAAYHDFRDQHWDESGYYQFLLDEYGFESYDETSYGPYCLSSFGSNAYDEIIGKAGQFACGWDDFVPDPSGETYGTSLHQNEYLNLWESIHGE